MTRTLPVARDAFITAMNRDTAGTDRPRYTAVLDALIEWSLARPEQLQFRSEESASGVVSFQRVGTNAVFWAVRPMRGSGPKMELLPRAAALLSAEKRAAARDTLNGCSRDGIDEGDRLSITFGPLKNPAARETVFSLMDNLLQTT